MDGGDPRVGWWANGYSREISWRINYAVTPFKFDTAANAWKPKFGRKLSSVRNSSNKVLFAENHYEEVYGDRWGVLTIQGHLWGAGVLTDTDVLRNSRVSPRRHGVGFAVAFFDGSARTISFAERDNFIGSAATYLTNYATMGVGPHWDLDAP
jgi:hypothetical protein